MAFTFSACYFFVRFLDGQTFSYPHFAHSNLSFFMFRHSKLVTSHGLTTVNFFSIDEYIRMECNIYVVVHKRPLVSGVM